MDIVASDSKRYVSVDSRNNESTEVVKLKNTNNEFTGKFFIQNDSTLKDINDVFVQNVSIIGREGSRIDGVVKTNGQGQRVVEIPLEVLECEEISVDRLYVGGIPILNLIPQTETLNTVQTLPTNGTTLNETIGKLNELIGVLKTIANNQQTISAS